MCRQPCTADSRWLNASGTVSFLIPSRLPFIPGMSKTEFTQTWTILGQNLHNCTTERSYTKKILHPEKSLSPVISGCFWAYVNLPFTCPCKERRRESGFWCSDWPDCCPGNAASEHPSSLLRGGMRSRIARREKKNKWEKVSILITPQSIVFLLKCSSLYFLMRC